MEFRIARDSDNPGHLKIHGFATLAPSYIFDGFPACRALGSGLHPVLHWFNTGASQLRRIHVSLCNWVSDT